MQRWSASYDYRGTFNTHRLGYSFPFFTHQACAGKLSLSIAKVTQDLLDKLYGQYIMQGWSSWHDSIFSITRLDSCLQCVEKRRPSVTGTEVVICHARLTWSCRSKTYNTLTHPGGLSIMSSRAGWASACGESRNIRASK